MEIKSKYNLRDAVWVMNDGRPRRLTVRQIQVIIDSWWTFPNEYKVTFSYFLTSGETAFSHHEWYSSKDIFSSKEKLLQAL